MRSAFLTKTIGQHFLFWIERWNKCDDICVCSYTRITWNNCHMCAFVIWCGRCTGSNEETIRLIEHFVFNVNMSVIMLAKQIRWNPSYPCIRFMCQFSLYLILGRMLTFHLNAHHIPYIWSNANAKSMHHNINCLVAIIPTEYTLLLSCSIISNMRKQ